MWCIIVPAAMAKTGDAGHKICIEAVRAAVLAVHGASGLIVSSHGPQFRNALRLVRSSEGLLRAAITQLQADVVRTSNSNRDASVPRESANAASAGATAASRPNSRRRRNRKPKATKTQTEDMAMDVSGDVPSFGSSDLACVARACPAARPDNAMPEVSISQDLVVVPPSVIDRNAVYKHGADGHAYTLPQCVGKKAVASGFVKAHVLHHNGALCTIMEHDSAAGKFVISFPVLNGGLDDVCRALPDQLQLL